VLYAEHHRLIRARDYDVVSGRPTLSRSRKLWTIARTWWHWRRTRDPVAVFKRVSAIPSDEPAAEERVDKGRARWIPSPAAWILRR
jgi:phytoene synthase (EC 2.5.1.32)